MGVETHTDTGTGKDTDTHGNSHMFDVRSPSLSLSLSTPSLPLSRSLLRSLSTRPRANPTTLLSLSPVNPLFQLTKTVVNHHLTKLHYSSRGKQGPQLPLYSQYVLLCRSQSLSHAHSRTRTRSARARSRISR